MNRQLEDLCVALCAWIPTKVGMIVRLAAWKPLFNTCGKVRFSTGIDLIGCASMALADGVRLGKGCHVYAEGGKLEIGENSALSPGVTIDASSGHIRMGDHVAVGPGTVIRAANHRFDRTDVPIMFQGHEYGEVIIENDVWIAANCTITPGVRIGCGAIVGGGAVVTRDVEPYTIVAGVPARVIGQRKAQ